MAHMCQSKVILNSSETVTCYLLGEEEEAGSGGGAGKLASCRFLGEVRRTPSRDLKLSLSPLLNALSSQADSHVPATSPGRFRKSLCLLQKPSSRPSWQGQTHRFSLVLSCPLLSSRGNSQESKKTLSSSTSQLLSFALATPARQRHCAASLGVN